MSHTIIPSQAASARTPSNAPTAKPETSADAGGPGPFTALLAAALSDVAPSLAETTLRGDIGDIGDEQVAQGIAALAELLSDEEQEVTAEMLAVLASMSSPSHDAHGAAASYGSGAGAPEGAAEQAAAGPELVASARVADRGLHLHAPTDTTDTTATTATDEPPAAASATAATAATAATSASDPTDLAPGTGPAGPPGPDGPAGGRPVGAPGPALVDGVPAATEASAAGDGPAGRSAASVPAGSEMNPASAPAPATAVATDPGPLPAAAPTETASATHARLVARVMDALDVLENAPPPRRMTIEVPDADGLRLQVALRGGEVHVSVQAGSSTDVTGWSRELSAGLAARGFSLGGFDSGARRQPRDDDAQGQGRTPGAPPEDPPQRGVRTDHDLRL